MKLFLPVLLSMVMGASSIAARGGSGPDLSQAVSDIRSIVSAQFAYSTVDGTFGDAACLVAPRSCHAGYDGPPFLEESLLQPERHGYRFSLKRGPGGMSFTLTAVPIAPGKGARGLCADDTGMIRVSEDGSEPRTLDGHCDPAYRELDTDKDTPVQGFNLDLARIELSPNVAAALAGRLPRFGPASGRRGLSATRQMAIPNTNGHAWFVEFRWQEGTTPRVGLAAIIRTAYTDGVKWIVEDGTWGVQQFTEDEDWENLIESLNGARNSANEAAVVGHVRSVISAQAIYESASAGHYGTLACLVDTPSCLPGIGNLGFLDAGFLGAERFEYRFRLVLGPGNRSFAYTASPIRVGDGGQRAFCGDASGRVCAAEDGGEPSVIDGRCDPGCPDYSEAKKVKKPKPRMVKPMQEE